MSGIEEVAVAYTIGSSTPVHVYTDNADFTNVKIDMEVDYLKGTAGNDYITGSSYIDTANPSTRYADDEIRGMEGADSILGGGGNDIIHGDMPESTTGHGADTIEGGAGNDLLSGGGLSDTFVFRPGHERDTIRDYGADNFNGHDTIKLIGTGYTSFAQVQAVATQQGPDVQIALSPTDQITLANVNISNIDAYDFSFA